MPCPQNGLLKSDFKLVRQEYAWFKQFDKAKV